MEKLIHLTSAESYFKILESGRIISKSKLFGKKVSFFILDNDIPKWLRFRKFFEDLLDHVSRGYETIGVIEFPILDYDRFFVLDRFCLQTELSLYGKKTDLGEKCYLYSLIPLRDYKMNYQKIYILPEVVSFSSLALYGHKSLLLEKSSVFEYFRSRFPKY